MDIDDLRIFIRVAAVQNLSTVGQEFGLTAGTISKRIQALEDRFALRLFDRTTRSVRITQEGQFFLKHATAVIDELGCVEAFAAEAAQTPAGRIKFATPANVAGQDMAAAIFEFMSRHPRIEIQADYFDRAVNLHEEGYDLTIRSGALSDSALIAKRLKQDRYAIVAAPGYLEGKKKPLAPRDLARHECLILSDNQQWSFRKRGRERSVKVKGRFRSMSADFIHRAALAGKGIARLPQNRVAADLKAGRLNEVISDYEPVGAAAVWLVHPSSRHVPLRVRCFVDFLSDWFSDQPSDIGASHGLSEGSVPPPLQDLNPTTQPGDGNPPRPV